MFSSSLPDYSAVQYHARFVLEQRLDSLLHTITFDYRANHVLSMLVSDVYTTNMTTSA
jgi:hypothetical protein